MTTKPKNRPLWGIIIIVLWLASILLVYSLGARVGLEPLRLEMEEKGLVFCEPVYMGFNDPIGVPVNTTWNDLEVYNNGR